MIIGADQDRYTLDDDDVGQQVVVYTDGEGTESVVSSVSDVISNVNDARVR